MTAITGGRSCARVTAGRATTTTRQLPLSVWHILMHIYKKEALPSRLYRLYMRCKLACFAQGRGGGGRDKKAEGRRQSTGTRLDKAGVKWVGR
jgi:hypothetical protein